MIGNCTHLECVRTGRITRGLCDTHYMRLLRTGDASKVRPPGKTYTGKDKHKLYKAWAGMVNRCHNPRNSSYGRYGAVGIIVCQRWRDDFWNFLADMGDRPEGMSLDRIDPYGNYAPENCRWATAKEQRANITAEGDMRMRAAVSKGVKAYWARKKLGEDVTTGADEPDADD